MGHARALVSAGDESSQVALFNRVVSENLSVRDIEALIRGEEISKPTLKSSNGTKSKKITISNTELVLKERLSDVLSTNIKIQKSPNGNGKIIIEFTSDNDLQRIMELLNQ